MDPSLKQSTRDETVRSHAVTPFLIVNLLIGLALTGTQAVYVRPRLLSQVTFVASEVWAARGSCTRSYGGAAQKNVGAGKLWATRNEVRGRLLNRIEFSDSTVGRPRALVLYSY